MNTTVERLRAVAAHIEKHELDHTSQVGVMFATSVNLYTPRGERLAGLLSWARTLGDDVTIKAASHAGNYHLSAAGRLDDGTPVEVTAIAHDKECHQVALELDYQATGNLSLRILTQLVDEQAAPSGKDGVE